MAKGEFKDLPNRDQREYDSATSQANSSNGSGGKSGCCDCICGTCNCFYEFMVCMESCC